MIKRYSLPDEEKAKELILALTKEEIYFKNVTVTEATHGIVCLGFQNKYEYNQETDESILIKEGTTYDIDIAWKNEPVASWNEFEVDPKTPNHKFA